MITKTLYQLQMSIVAKNIGDFIEFCRDVCDRTVRLADFDYKKAGWGSGLGKFHAQFNQNPEAFIQVIERFINDNRDSLETPIFDEDGKPNDKWLKVPKEVDVSAADDGWTRKSKGPRGIVIWLNPDNEKLAVIYLPVSEVYQACLSMYHAKINLKHTTYDDIPVTFLMKFFQCLDSIEANNHYFEQNIADTREELGGSEADVDDDSEEKQPEGIMALMKGFNAQNMGAFFQQAKSNPMVRFMTKNATGLDGESLDKFFDEAPVMLTSVQASVMTGPAVKTILEQESIQEMMMKNPMMAAAVQEIAAASRPTEAPLATEHTVEDAEEQE